MPPMKTRKFRRGRVHYGRPTFRDSTEEEVLPPRSILRDMPDPNEETQDVGAMAAQTTMGVTNVGVGNSSHDPPVKKCGRGPAKGTLFERLRKMGKIPLVIQDSHRGPSCENASIFTGRLTHIIKVYADMRHASWSQVPEEEKQELVDHVKTDFVLDWTRENHREMVLTHLADKYNAYHYALHKVYRKYGSHEEALRGGTSMVEKPVWQFLCERWASQSFKEKSRRNSMNRQKLKVKHTGGRKSFIRILTERRETTTNMVALYKQTHWSTKKGKFINATTEHNYNLMLERIAERETEEDMDQVANDAFKEVLGFRSGYTIGMGHMVIPEPSPSMRKNKDFICLSKENQRNKSEVEIYKSKVDQMMLDIEMLKKGFSIQERVTSRSQFDLGGVSESQTETQRDA